jgi:hypothetical protein
MHVTAQYLYIGIPKLIPNSSLNLAFTLVYYLQKIIYTPSLVKKHTGVGRMADDEEFDRIVEDPDEQVDDDEMSPAEAGFTKGEEEASDEEEKKEEHEEDFDEEELR